MVFSSLPIYLDPPNWNQQTTSHQPPGGAAINQPPQHPSFMADPPPHPAGLPGPTRPVSMAERARLAKIPQPEPALKCPRCDSINTKFCYFNNYSLSQPRHFCKTCRRYWTRGGALRNVPVGGGCRRNKRTKAGPASSKTAFSTGASSSTASASMNLTTMLPPPPPPQQLPFMAHFQPLADYSATNIGLGFAGIHPLDSVDYQIGSGGGGGGAGLEQWRMQQFPFMGGLDASPAAPATVAGLFPFDGESGGNDHQGFSTGRMLTKASSSGLISQMASVKMEDSSHGINLQRQYMGAVTGNEQYWDGNGDGGGSAGNGGGGGGWLGDLSGFNSSSSGNIL